MLARRLLPVEYQSFNARYGAPSGRHRFVVGMADRIGGPVQGLMRTTPACRWRGPFAHQWNTRTRAYEYPWVHHQLASLGPSRILEIGGALSGFQFALAAEGHEVHNVDPFLDYGDAGYAIDPVVVHAALNRAFRTNVTLHRTTVPEAALAGPFDAVVCVSTIEHLSREDIAATMAAAREVLVPGGLVVLTVDLFLDLAPFTDRVSNRWGANVPISWLQETLGTAEIVQGVRDELYGCDGFSPVAVLSRLEEYAMSADYPQLAQMVAFRLGD